MLFREELCIRNIQTKCGHNVVGKMIAKCDFPWACEQVCLTQRAATVLEIKVVIVIGGLL